MVVVVDPGLGVSAEQFAAAWNVDPDAAGRGVARVEPAAERAFVPGLVEWVVLPLAVNLLSSAVYDVIKRVATRNSGRRKEVRREVSEVEVVEFTSAGGDRVLVVRSRREVS